MDINISQLTQSKYYSVGQPLGATNISIVYKAKLKQPQGNDGTVLAIKVIKYKKQNLNTNYNDQLMQKQFVKSEIQKYQILNHPHLIKIHQTFDNTNTGLIGILMDYCQLSLNQKIKQNTYLTISQIKKYLHQIAQGLKYLHQQKGIIHRDLKPQNILLKDNQIKIIDLGFAKNQQTNNIYNSKSLNGTFQYFAPQLQSSEYYTEKIDIWALGIIMLQLLTKKRIRKLLQTNFKLSPYQVQGFPQAYLKSIQDIQMRVLVQRMLKAQPIIRISATQILQQLGKPQSFQNNPQKKDSNQQQKYYLLNYINSLQQKITKMTKQFNSKKQLQLKISNLQNIIHSKTLQIAKLTIQKTKIQQQYQNIDNKLNQTNDFLQKLKLNLQANTQLINLDINQQIIKIQNNHQNKWIFLSKWVHNLKQLYLLDIGLNDIQQIPNLSILVNLIQLDMSNNKIRYINNINPLINLQYLNLSNNLLDNRQQQYIKNLKYQLTHTTKKFIFIKQLNHQNLKLVNVSKSQFFMVTQQQDNSNLKSALKSPLSFYSGSYVQPYFEINSQSKSYQITSLNQC